MKPPPQVSWHAGADGEGHAILRGRQQTRALCGSPRHEERFDHPVAHRHDECVAKLNRLTQDALSETETRFAWGDK